MATGSWREKMETLKGNKEAAGSNNHHGGNEENREQKRNNRSKKKGRGSKAWEARTRRTSWRLSEKFDKNSMSSGKVVAQIVCINSLVTAWDVRSRWTVSH
jgi:hypothetical protein